MLKPALLAACMLGLSSVPAGATAIVYALNDPVGSVGSVTGTITTDGVIGTLTTADILSYNLEVVGNGASTSLTSGNSGVFGSGNALSATATQLFFDFSDTNPSYLLFQKSFLNGSAYACAASTTYSSTPCYQGASAVPGSYNDTSAQYTGEGEGPGNILQGNLVIGTAVPEPATWAMMLVGFGMVGFGLRKRSKVRTTVSYA